MGPPRRARTVALSVGGLVLLTAAPGQASSAAQQRSPVVTSTATWGLVLRSTDGRSYVGAPLDLLFGPSALSGTSQYVTAVNTGTARLLGATYALQANGMGLMNIAVSACRGGAWDAVTGTCPGTAVTIAPSATGTASTAVPTEPGETLSLRVRVASVITSPLSMQLTASVTSGPLASRQLASSTTSS